MKTLINFQKFTEQTNKGFVNVPTLDAKKTWRNLLLDYRYLHSLGVIITKKNRNDVFNTLQKLKSVQDNLIIAIDKDETQEIKTALIEEINALQSFLHDLSLLRDEETETEETGTPFEKTMIYFDKTEINDKGETVYITKGGKRFTVKNKINENLHYSLIEKCNIEVIKRVEAKKEAKKEAEKESKETVKKEAKTKTVSIPKNKVIDPKEAEKKAEKKAVKMIGIERNNDKFVERLYEKKRLS